MRRPSPNMMKVISSLSGSTSQAVPEPPRYMPAPPELVISE